MDREISLSHGIVMFFFIAVNLGSLVLQALLEYWPSTFGTKAGNYIQCTIGLLMFLMVNVYP